MNAYPVMFAPIAQERVWGGHQLKAWFSVETDRPIGEYWVLSAYPGATNVVVNGPLAGKTVLELTEELPHAYLGTSPQARFPLLIKFLEASEPLSVQIHPDDDYARRVEGDFGKTEAWYILDHKPDASVICGHVFKSREEYKRAALTNRIQDFLQHRSITREDLVFVPARTLHALLAGTTLIEIQQTSDITYRVYDWERRGRELHLEKAADVMTYGDETTGASDTDQERRILFENRQVRHEHLVTCPFFTIEKIDLCASAHTFALGKTGNPDILIVADGEGMLTWNGGDLPLQRGSTVLVPSTCDEYQLKTATGFRVLRTYY